MQKVPELVLNNIKMPQLGFGTWNIHDSGLIANVIKAGYRLIDTAKIYGNEASVGEGMKKSGVPRSELFVTTKLWTSDQGYYSTHKAFEESLERLGLEYVDLYLIHWPKAGTKGYLESWKAMSEIYSDGRVKAIGVSNFSVEQIQDIMEDSDIKPAVNQIRFNPFDHRSQISTVNFAHQNDIAVEAYSPLSQGSNMDHAEIVRIAEVHGKSNAQVMLRWALQHGTIPIPKSSNLERAKENMDVFNFELTEGEMQELNNLD
jgi:diketogulonate reductase-like aldo/keto reductase